MNCHWIIRSRGRYQGEKGIWAGLGLPRTVLQKRLSYFTLQTSPDIQEEAGADAAVRFWCRNYRNFHYPNVADVEEEHMLSHFGMDGTFSETIYVCWDLNRGMFFSLQCFGKQPFAMQTRPWQPSRGVQEKRDHMFNAFETVHSCADWQILVESIAERVVRVMRLCVDRIIEISKSFIMWPRVF